MTRWKLFKLWFFGGPIFQVRIQVVSKKEPVTLWTPHGDFELLGFDEIEACEIMPVSISEFGQPTRSIRYSPKEAK